MLMEQMLENWQANSTWRKNNPGWNYFHANKLIKWSNILYKISFYNYIINITQSDKIIVYFCYYIVYLL